MLNINKIEKLRNDNNLSQAEFSERIGLTRVGYQGIVKRGDLKVSQLVQIAESFNVSILNFFDCGFCGIDPRCF